MEPPRTACLVDHGIEFQEAIAQIQIPLQASGYFEMILDIQGKQGRQPGSLTTLVRASNSQSGSTCREFRESKRRAAHFLSGVRIASPAGAGLSLLALSWALVKGAPPGTARARTACCPGVSLRPGGRCRPAAC